MRSISLLSAALCGALWISLNVGGVVAQGFGLHGITTTTSTLLQRISLDSGSASTSTPTPVEHAGGTDSSTTPASAVIDPGSIGSSTNTSPTQQTTSKTEYNTAPTSTSAVIDPGSIGSSTNSLLTQQTPKTTSKKNSNTAPIVGGVVGGIVALALILGAAFLFWRRRRHAATGTEDFGVLEKHRASSPSVYPAAGIITYDTPSPAPQLSPVPAIASVESHHLMGGYSESGLPASAEIAPVVGAAKPYTTNTQSEVDDDGVSLRSPSPVHEGVSPAGERGSVPRLPIYNRGAGDTTDRGPAL